MSFSNLLKRASAKIEKSYEDDLIIFGTSEIENPDGTTDVEEDIEISRVKCRLSIIKSDTTELEDVNIHKESYKVFCNYNVKINEGDTIRVNKIIDDKVVSSIKGIATKPSVYGLAQEIVILNIGAASEL